MNIIDSTPCFTKLFSQKLLCRPLFKTITVGYVQGVIKTYQVLILFHA